jgi:6-phosphogluconolactonase (cycloisomerase 2 family)
VLYAVGSSENEVIAYRVLEDGDLRILASRSSHGTDPCHLAVRPDGAALAVANYEDGTVSVYRLDPQGVMASTAVVLRPKGGGPHPTRQSGPHAHMCRYASDGSLLTVDLGGDAIHRYLPGLSAHPGGALHLRPGSGPRHIVGDGLGHWYVVGEIDATVGGWREEFGTWTEVGTVAASAREGANLPSHLALSADGCHLYVGNRGPDTLSVFSAADGYLVHLTEVRVQGHWPRHFALDQDRLYIAAEHSDEVVSFRFDPGGREPHPTGYSLSVRRPSCILLWEPAHRSCDDNSGLQDLVTCGPP